MGAKSSLFCITSSSKGFYLNSDVAISILTSVSYFHDIRPNRFRSHSSIPNIRNYVVISAAMQFSFHFDLVTFIIMCMPKIGYVAIGEHNAVILRFGKNYCTYNFHFIVYL